MTLKEVAAMEMINHLPCRLPSRKLIMCHKSTNLFHKSSGTSTVSRPTSGTPTLRRPTIVKGTEQSSIDCPTSGCPPNQPQPVWVAFAFQPTPITVVYPDPQEGREAKKGKRKSHCQGEKSSSHKKSCKDGGPSKSLIGGVFGIEFQLGAKVVFNLVRDKKNLVEKMSHKEALDATFEMVALTTLLILRVVETTNSGSKKLKEKLATM
ncbi:hypothetical protein LR48_Vigan08g141000 [Vigna angularis]|uniref:Uncharacterized protein n=1 Tax=Phaseolus angularis TaxID=3914 RepID=A0A0L9V6H0_PHAAN|nr:hypothetical protein LR48_Vigan08g141000 [Vigna angularis]